MPLYVWKHKAEIWKWDHVYCIFQWLWVFSIRLLNNWQKKCFVHIPQTNNKLFRKQIRCRLSSLGSFYSLTLHLFHHVQLKQWDASNIANLRFMPIYQLKRKRPSWDRPCFQHWNFAAAKGATPDHQTASLTREASVISTITFVFCKLSK